MSSVLAVLKRVRHSSIGIKLPSGIFRCLTTYHITSRALTVVMVAESLNVLVGYIQGCIGDFCLLLFSEGSLLRHLSGVSELYCLYLHGLGLGDLALPLPCQGTGAGLMP